MPDITHHPATACKMYTVHKTIIEEAWENRVMLNHEDTRKSIEEVIEGLDKGKLRVAEKEGKEWKVNQWVKKAVILYFPTRKMVTSEMGPLEFHDKIPLKSGYHELGVRVAFSCQWIPQHQCAGIVFGFIALIFACHK